MNVGGGNSTASLVDLYEEAFSSAFVMTKNVAIARGVTVQNSSMRRPYFH